MKIGQVADLAEVSIDTVRFYERRGVLPVPERTPSGYRSYTPATVERIRLARRLQRLGLTLDEVIDALHATDRGDTTCTSERWRLEAVLDRIEHKIAAPRRGHPRAPRHRPRGHHLHIRALAPRGRPRPHRHQDRRAPSHPAPRPGRDDRLRRWRLRVRPTRLSWRVLIRLCCDICFDGRLHAARRRGGRTADMDLGVRH